MSGVPFVLALYTENPEKDRKELKRRTRSVCLTHNVPRRRHEFDALWAADLNSSLRLRLTGRRLNQGTVERIEYLLTKNEHSFGPNRDCVRVLVVGIQTQRGSQAHVQLEDTQYIYNVFEGRCLSSMSSMDQGP